MKQKYTVLEAVNDENLWEKLRACLEGIIHVNFQCIAKYAFILCLVKNPIMVLASSSTNQIQH